MYGNKCERCGATENANQIKLIGGVPVCLCPKCLRVFQAALAGTEVRASCQSALRRSVELESRAAGGDSAAWPKLEPALKRYEDALSAVDIWVVAWVEAECGPKEKGADPEE